MSKSRMRNIVIVGVSEGLGSSMVAKYLESGCRVLISARNEEKLERIAGKMKGGSNLICTPGDVSSRKGVDAVMKAAKQRLGSVDALVIQVGGYGEDSIRDYGMLDSMLENHVRIPVMVVSSALAVMDSGSSILLVSSAETLGYPEPNKMSYTIAKSSLNRLTESLASQLLSSGIRVNAIAPSYIQGDAEKYVLGGNENPPDLIAEVVDWITGDDSVLINGAIIPVDGGHRFMR
ncbi:MAG: SDR family oxidoreductase [Candidatus Thermoplasmatota archaeon]|nr:SDR family oxidoreductase [Candidatus Thermoplasmatota archaeon]